MGTAGGFSSNGCQIGDVILSSSIKFHDRRFPVQGFTEYGRGNYQSIAISRISKTLKVKVGPVSTGDSLVATEVELGEMRRLGVLAKDMEAASVAWVASMFDTPVLAIKSITDLVDTDTNVAAEFERNFEFAVTELWTKVSAFLGHVLGRDLAELGVISKAASSK